MCNFKSISAATLLCVFTLAPVRVFAAEADVSCNNRTNNTQKKLLQCITVERVRAHQTALQAVADAYAGNRAAGTPGYDASVDYVATTLASAGYQVELNPFELTLEPTASLEQTAPFNAEYETSPFNGSATGDVAGPVIPVDLALDSASWPQLPAASTSGCETSDFVGLDFSGPNDIALIQRGSCFFSVKATNAQLAGAEAVIFFNQGNAPERMDLITGSASTLPDGTPANLTIPVVGASFAQGVALAGAGAAATVTVEPAVTRTQYNVVAELPGKSGKVVMVGAHLDSVPEGPGIQDNGSGSAAILEAAIQLAKVKPHNTIRFAWWGAEEAGLVGSTSYVSSLPPSELEDIVLYLNFDRIGSPNYVYFIYDGDDSDGIGAGPGPAGSADIEEFFERFYIDAGVPFKGTDFDRRSAYAPFSAVGIPSGGLFTGSEVVKTPEEAAIWGGVAGEQYDQCYHLACDTYDNISIEALEINSTAAAAAILQFGMNTEAINGMRGKGNFKAPRGPNM